MPLGRIMSLCFLESFWIILGYHPSHLLPGPTFPEASPVLGSGSMIEEFVYTSTAAIQRIIPTSSNPYPPTLFYGFFLVKTRPWIFITDLQTLLHSTGIVKPSGFGTSSWIGLPFIWTWIVTPYGLPLLGSRKFQPLDLLFFNRHFLPCIQSIQVCIKDQSASVYLSLSLCSYKLFRIPGIAYLFMDCQRSLCVALPVVPSNLERSSILISDPRNNFKKSGKLM
ncbi:hypothetical protein EYC80_008889 [Monilinia laxa]|uniref:LAGLIDADG endonuclease n=1 Tax=Monilinia laxa TaxID=61186 RepID=A0A5N6K1R1_MONLA|nr:hypothetical protein EYC80_008889 [Monilinia laxa]